MIFVYVSAVFCADCYVVAAAKTATDRKAQVQMLICKDNNNRSAQSTFTSGNLSAKITILLKPLLTSVYR